MNRKIKFSVILILLVVKSLAQSPDFYPPTVPEQIEITPFNVVLYLIVPLLIILAYFLYRNSQKKKQQEKKRQEKKENKRNES